MKKGAFERKKKSLLEIRIHSMSQKRGKKEIQEQKAK